MSTTSGTRRPACSRPASSRDRHRGGEAGDGEVGGVHLEHERGRVVDRRGVVGEVHPVGRADLAQPGAHRLHQLGDAEAVADLDQLAAGDDHGVAPVVAARQHPRDEGEGGGAVVDDVDPAGVGHGGGQRVQRAAARVVRAARSRGPARRRWPRPPCATASTAAPDSGARPRLVWTTTPVALTTRRSVVADAGSAATAASATAAGSSSPARHRSSAAVTACLTRTGPSRVAARLQARVGQDVVGAGRGPARIWHPPSSSDAGSGRLTTGSRLAEADGNRTRPTQLLGRNGFEDRVRHQTRTASASHPSASRPVSRSRSRPPAPPRRTPTTR